MRTGYLGGALAVGMAAVLTLAMAPTTSSAQTPVYPTRPIRLVIPYPPGGAYDALARPFAEKLSKRLGQPVVIDNRGGGGTIVGSEFVARAAPDGYTLLMNGSAYATTAALGQAPYDPITAFVQVARLATLTHLLVVNPKLPVDSFAGLIAYAKQNPGKLNFGTSGQGGDTHLRTAQLRAMTGIDFEIVNFRGAGPQMLDLVAGNTDAGFISLTAVGPQVAAGKAKVLANSAQTRSRFLPDVPSVSETVAGYAFSLWIGIAAPANTPAAIVQRLNKEIEGLLTTDEELKAAILALSQVPSYQGPSEFDAFVKKEIAEYSGLVKQLNIKAE